MNHINIPGFNEELVLQQYGEYEEDDAHGCHGDEVAQHDVPLERTLHHVVQPCSQNHTSKYEVYIHAARL